MMPKVIGNDSLIARVNEVQGCMYRQSNELGRLNKAVRRYKEENTKLRELLADLAICACGKYCYGCPHQYDGCNRDQRLRELGIEVSE